MESYRNLSGTSGIAAFELGSDFVRVRFLDNSVYLYSCRSAGRGNIDQMKRLAVAGRGLNTFINTAVRKAYERREF